ICSAEIPATATARFPLLLILEVAMTQAVLEVSRWLGRSGGRWPPLFTGGSTSSRSRIVCSALRLTALSFLVEFHFPSVTLAPAPDLVRRAVTIFCRATKQCPDAEAERAVSS